MKTLFLIFVVFLTQLIASQILTFGVISTVNPDIMKHKLKPLMREIEKTTGKKVKFQTGYDYTDTINKFADGTFDIGYIGPVPYIKTQDINPHALEILAGIKNSKKSPFRSVIISKKGSKFKKLKDLKNTSFAFGSPKSTLSYYIPKHILVTSGTMKDIKNYHFLGRHDKVAQYVIMGKFAAGAIKQSIATKYSKYLQIIVASKPMSGFMIVANKKLNKQLVQQIKTMLLNIQKLPEKFELRTDRDYNELRKIIKEIDSYK